MIMSEHIFIPIIVLHPIFEANHTKVSKVQLESWHVVVAKFHDLPTLPSIDQINVIPRVVMVHNEEEISQLKGALACWY